MSNNISGVKKKLNILFAGTPEFAAKILEDLLINFDNQFNLTAVYTQPDREAGRGRKLTPSAVKQLVLDKLINIPLNIPIEQPLDFKDPNTIEKLRSYQPDLIIVVAYGLILPQALLDIPTYGCINIHASLLPRWRGAAPIQRAILAGDVETGVCIQQMERGLDTGPVISSAKSLIDNNETTESLTNKLLQLAISLLNKYLKNLLLSHINPAQYSFQQAIPQDHSYATYAHKLTKAESIIDWTQSAELIYRKIRALNPWPSVTTNLNNINNNNKINFKIISAIVINNHTDLPAGTIINSHNKKIIIQTGKNQLEITQLQFSGGKAISAQDALNGQYKNLLTANNVLF